MRLNFHKMHGCGNDFLFLDYMNMTPPHIYPHEVVFLCDRHYGIGADGLVILHQTEGTHAAWKFFNSDGSEAEMCGNAARCAVRFLAEKYYKDDPTISLETKAGVIKGRMLEDGRVEIALMHRGMGNVPLEEKFILFEDKMLQVFLINTGVPHAVYEVKDIYTYPIERVGKFLSRHEVFHPTGTNVTFFQRLVGPKILSTTFERGVEKETLACGTGAAAAALIYAELYMHNLPIEVNVPGGELTVDISPVSKMLLLQGNAEPVMQVEIDKIPHGFEQPRLFTEGKKK